MDFQERYAMAGDESSQDTSCSSIEDDMFVRALVIGSNNLFEEMQQSDN